MISTKIMKYIHLGGAIELEMLQSKCILTMDVVHASDLNPGFVTFVED